MPKVAVIMGSGSDLPVLQPAFSILREFGIEYEARVISAHRTPDVAHVFAKTAESAGFEVIIAAAGKAAHLAGVIAAQTPLPVIGVPVKSSFMDGLDSLLSTVQMPPGVPVATIAINGADNAAILAAQILSVKYPGIRAAIIAYKEKLAEKVMKKDRELSENPV